MDGIAGATTFVRERLATGAHIEDVLWALRAAPDGGTIQAIGGVMNALGLSLVDARMVVETSPAFSDNPEVHREYRQELLARLGLSG